MQKRITPFFIFGLLQVGSILTFAQQEVAIPRPKKNYIQVNLGLMHSRLINEGYSTKLLFRGTNWKFGLGYGRETSQYLFTFSIDANRGKVESKGGNLPSDFYLIHPSLEYSRKIRQVQFFGRPGTLLAGLSLSSINYIITNQPIFDNVSILSLHGSYLNLGCQLNISAKQRLHLTYRLPAMVYTNHLVWNGGASNLTYDDQEHFLRTLTTHGSFSYFDVLRNIQLNAAYELSMGRNTQFVAMYKFVYVSSSSEPPAHVYSNELSIGLKIRF